MDKVIRNDAPLRFEVRAGNSAPVLIIPADGRGLMVLPDAKGVPMVYIAPDGRAELRDDYDADEASRAFWTAIGALTAQCAPWRAPGISPEHLAALQAMMRVEPVRQMMTPRERNAVEEAIRIFSGSPQS